MVWRKSQRGGGRRPGSATVKRKAAADGAAKAAKALKVNYVRWTEADKKVALEAVVLMKGSKALALG